jgi:hypothetical protein
MLAGVDVKRVLKRGALVAAANWQLTAIQFLADTTFKMLLAVPIIGGVLLVVLLLGRELPELLSGDLRESASFVATALSAEPVALGSFVLASSIVALAGSVFMFLVKGGTVAVLAEAERMAIAVEEPPLHLEPLWTVARFSLDRFLAGCRTFFRRYLRLGLILTAVYAVSIGAYLAVLIGRSNTPSGGRLGWTLVAGIGSAILVTWITLVNFCYLLVQMVIVVGDCSVRSAARRVAGFVRAQPRMIFSVFGVVLLLVAGATIVSIIATTSLGVIAFVPLAGLAVVPLQLLAWLFRGLVFQYLGLGALCAYLALYRSYSAPAAAPAAAALAGPFRGEG